MFVVVDDFFESLGLGVRMVCLFLVTRVRDKEMLNE